MPKLSLPAAVAEARRAAKTDPLTVELNIAGPPFLCVGALQMEAFLDVQSTSETRYALVRDVMRLVLDPSEHARFDECLASPDAEVNIGFDILAAMLPQITEHYTGRPTVPASPSPVGQGNTGNESVSTPATPVEID